MKIYLAVVSLYALAIAFFIALLVRQGFRRHAKPPVCTLQDIKLLYEREGRPDPFYIPNSWFEYVVNAIYVPPGDPFPKLPQQDEQGYFVLYNESKMRPECTRPK